MSSVTITVLMTVYNGGQYLKPAIESVLAQTFTDFEFLIINDCSRDHSVETIQAFADPRIRLVNNETNLGQTRSLNKGLSLATGRYIARMDADDFAFPTWLENNLSVLQAQPATAVSSCKALVIDGKNKIHKILNTPESYDEMVLRSLLATPVNHVGSVYKTDVITSLGGYDESLKIAADYELWSRMIRAKIRLSSVPQALVAIRVHDQSISIVEKGRIDISEISSVMEKNFKQLVTIPITPQEILQLWKLNYATQTLLSNEFRSAVSVFEWAYANLNPEWKIDEGVLKSFVFKQKKVFFAKRAFGEIEKGDLKELRSLTTEYSESQGWFNILSALWLASWFGRPIVKQVPRIYQRISSWSAHKKILHHSHPQLIQ